MGERKQSALRRGILRWRYIVLAAAIIAIGFGFSMRDIRQDMAAVEEADQQISQELIIAQEEYNQLSAQLEQVGSQSYIENVARQYYSFLRQDEVRFEIRNAEALSGYTYEEMQILQQERKPD